MFNRLVMLVAVAACSRAAAKETFRLDQTIADHGPELDLALFQSLGVHLSPGHQLELLNNGSVFDAVIADIGRATSSIDVEIYIWEKGVASQRVSAALIAQARSGVACRVLVDALGSAGFARELAPPLTAAGCDVRVFRPLPGPDFVARNHRKVVVIDGAIAYTGGFGIRDSWLGDGIHGWRDSNIRFTGPSVAGAQQAFAENWQEAGGPLLPEAAFPPPLAVPDGEGATAAFVGSSAAPVITHAERLAQLMIAAATKRLWITSAYFVPSRSIRAMLKAKAEAGVDVRLLVAGSKSDSKASYVAQQVEYPALLASGIRIWEYEPTMLHTKTILTNDRLAVVGSINLDPLSLNKLEESALVIDDERVGTALARQFEADCAHAKEQGKARAK